jgi:hypothetical protein
LSLTEHGRAFLAGRSQDAAIRRPARLPRWSSDRAFSSVWRRASRLRSF